jgi:uncharacterized repeat protein (TIGR01451 family)
VIYQQATGIFAPGNHSLTVKIPNSYYQIDFVCGQAIDQLEPNQNGNAYGPDSANILYHAENRFISADNGGTSAANPMPPPVSRTYPTPTTSTLATPPLTDSATLSGGYNPGGSITFYLFAPGVTPNTNNSNNVYSDKVTVNNGNGIYTTATGTNPGGFVPTATGTYQWVAVYSGDGNNVSVTSPFGSEPETVTAVAQITVVKTADQASITAGQTAGFTVTITNNGTITDTNVTLSDPLPAGAGGDITWKIDTTKGNASLFTITGTAPNQKLVLNPSPTTLAPSASLTVHIVGVTSANDAVGASAFAIYGAAANYAVLYEGNGGHNLSITNVTVNGTIGVGGTGKVQFSGPGTITGRLDFSAASTGQYSNNNASNVGPISVNYNVAAVTNALNTVNSLSSSLAGLGNNLAIGGTQTINESAGQLKTVNGVTYRVFNITSYSETDGSVVTINGDGSGNPVVFDFDSNTNVNLGGDVTLTGGLTDDQVIWNFTSSNQAVQLNNNASSYPQPAAFHGVILAPNDKISIVNASLDGRVFGGNCSDMQIVSGDTINAPMTSGTLLNTATVSATGVVPQQSSATIIITPIGATLGHGAAATIGYWHNNNGQALITGFNGSASSTALGNWLASKFPNLFGSFANQTNTQIAADFLTAFGNVGGVQGNTYAQTFAVALAVYATDPTLGGSAAASGQGFVVQPGGTGSDTFNVGSNGAAFGVANSSSLSVLQILQILNNNNNPATKQFYGGNSTLTTDANNVTNGINSTGDIQNATIGNTGLAYTPAQIRTAYGINNLSQDGTSQTIAVVDAYDNPQIYQSLDAFDTQFGLTNSGPTLYQQYGAATAFLTVLNQDGQATSLPATDPAGPGNGNWETEAALDVEWIHAIAPGARIVLVEANSQSLADLMSSVATAASQPGVSVVSMSWGFPEAQSVFANDEAAYDSTFTTPGVTFVASTGDYGTADPEYPAFSPNVVAVGGTSLYLNGDNSYNSETGWGYVSNDAGILIGSGGGVSQYESEPAFQQGVQSTGNRTTPDVSFVADPATGAWVADNYNLDPSNPFEIVGGTSLSAPSWAGLIALVNQGRVANGQATLNSVSPTEAQQALYSLSQNDYNVISSGTNGGYNAAPGYNLVTGLGSPVASVLVPDLITGNFPAGGQVAPINANLNANPGYDGTAGNSPLNTINVFSALTLSADGLAHLRPVYVSPVAAKGADIGSMEHKVETLAPRQSNDLSTASVEHSVQGADAAAQSTQGRTDVPAPAAQLQLRPLFVIAGNANQNGADDSRAATSTNTTSVALPGSTGATRFVASGLADGTGTSSRVRDLLFSGSSSGADMLIGPAADDLLDAWSDAGLPMNGIAGGQRDSLAQGWSLPEVGVILATAGSPSNELAQMQELAGIGVGDQQGGLLAGSEASSGLLFGSALVAVAVHDLGRLLRDKAAEAYTNGRTARLKPNGRPLTSAQ